MKRTASVFFILCLGIAFHLQGQNLPQGIARPEPISTDTVIKFHFVPGIDMFYARYKENEPNLHSFMNILSERSEQIRQGKAIVKVEGFCASPQSRKRNLSLAKIRSNRVKSYFITHAGLNEANYQTVNKDTVQYGYDNVVMLSLFYPSASTSADAQLPVTDIGRDVNNLQEKDSVSIKESHPIENEIVAEENTVVDAMDFREEPSVALPATRRTLFAVKTNLLYDLALTPNLELEIPIGRRWSINAEYQYGWWLRKDNTFCWQIEAGGLEGRYWLGNREKRDVLTGWFVGFFSSGGMYDFQLKKDEGRQGEFYIMAGASAGYALPIARNLHMEFSTGFGALVTNYRRYRVIDDELIKQGKSMKYKAVLPLKAKISLVWTIKGKKEAKK